MYTTVVAGANYYARQHANFHVSAQIVSGLVIGLVIGPVQEAGLGGGFATA
jgi:F0F1-type ATP synthase assembly protein I